MVMMKREFSLAVETKLDYQRCLQSLRESLQQHGFKIISQVPFHREFERQIGMQWDRYTVLVAWSPFHAYQALLSHKDGGLLMPFNIVVAEDGGSTFVAAINHAVLSGYAPVGIQILANDLAIKIREVLLSLAVDDARSIQPATPSAEPKEVR